MYSSRIYTETTTATIKDVPPVVDVEQGSEAVGPDRLWLAPKLPPGADVPAAALAKPGKYKVEAQYFGDRQQKVTGPTTLQVSLATKFGSAEQKEQAITLRLKGRGILKPVRLT